MEMEDDKDIKKTSRKKELTPERRKKRKKRRIILLAVIGIFILFRLFLPTIVLRYVNNKLANLTEYYGHVEDIDIHLYRGAYVIKDIKLLKRDKKTKDSIPFFSSPKVDLSVEWSSLFKGSLVGEIQLDKPVVNFVKGAHVGEDVKADTADFRKLIDALIPLTVNSFEIHKGEIHYIDLHASPKIDVFMTNINGKGTNLSNVENRKELLPASFECTGDAYEGKFSLNINYNAMAIQPAFDLTMEMSDMNLVLLNDFLKAYGNFDVKEGNVGIYAEFASNEGKFGGYVKPILNDLNIVQWNKEEGGIPQIIWESAVALGLTVFKNQIQGQFASKIPISGTLEKSHVDVLSAIGYVFKNAFIKALKPSVDNSVDIHTIEEKKPFFERIFEKEKKPKKKKNKRKS